jgi:hypothetical protein
VSPCDSAYRKNREVLGKLQKNFIGEAFRTNTRVELIQHLELGCCAENRKYLSKVDVQPRYCSGEQIDKSADSGYKHEAVSEESAAPEFCGQTR